MIFKYFETNFPRYHFNFTLSEDEMHNVVPKRSSAVYVAFNDNAENADRAAAALEILQEALKYNKIASEAFPAQPPDSIGLIKQLSELYNKIQELERRLDKKEKWVRHFCLTH